LSDYVIYVIGLAKPMETIVLFPRVTD